MCFQGTIEYMSDFSCHLFSIFDDWPMRIPKKLYQFFRLYLQSLNDSTLFLMEKDFIVSFIKFIFPNDLMVLSRTLSAT